ncbi:MAG: PorV/PorQ family protein, partial [Tannerella sp.]|nr:PorV/PorQ family protein [Tannerella sp.]
MRTNYIKMMLALACLPLSISAQNGHDAYAFLRFPASSRVNALGGHNVSLVENDPSLVFHNPALLGGEMDGRFNINYMNYISDVNVGSAVYTKAFGERSAFGIGASYITYGKMKETTQDNVILGEFSAQDIGLHAFYEYDLSEKWRGGLT